MSTIKIALTTHLCIHHDSAVNTSMQFVLWPSESLYADVMIHFWKQDLLSFGNWFYISEFCRFDRMWTFWDVRWDERGGSGGKFQCIWCFFAEGGYTSVLLLTRLSLGTLNALLQEKHFSANCLLEEGQILKGFSYIFLSWTACSILQTWFLKIRTSDWWVEVAILCFGKWRWKMRTGNFLKDSLTFSFF